MPMSEEDKIRNLCERERAALVSAARMRTALWPTGVGVVGLIAGLYIGRDVTLSILNDSIPRSRSF